MLPGVTLPDAASSGSRSLRMVPRIGPALVIPAGRGVPACCCLCCIPGTGTCDGGRLMLVLALPGRGRGCCAEAPFAAIARCCGGMGVEPPLAPMRGVVEPPLTTTRCADDPPLATTRGDPPPTPPPGVLAPGTRVCAARC